LAWQSLEDEPSCPGCGNDLAVSTDFEKRLGWQVETVTCHACRLKDARSDGASAGDFVVVTRKDGRG
jgi:transcription elongation factor Elf1